MFSKAQARGWGVTPNIVVHRQPWSSSLITFLPSGAKRRASRLDKVNLCPDGKHCAPRSLLDYGDHPLGRAQQRVCLLCRPPSGTRDAQ